MSLELIIEGVPDHRRLKDIRPDKCPMTELISAYETLSKANPHIVKFDPTWTVAELREAIGKLTTEERHAVTGMLDTDINQCNGPWAYETPKEREERQLIHFIIKVTVVSIIPTIMMLVGAIVIIGMISGKVNPHILTETLLTTVTEVLKIIFDTSA